MKAIKRIILYAVILIPRIMIGQVPNTFSDTEKIFGLSTLWKEVEYNFAYFDKIGSQKWDSLYQSMIGAVLKTSNDYEYYRELSRFMAFLKDGHTGVGRYPNVDRYTTIFRGYLIEFGRVEGKVIVMKVNASKRDSIPLGSELLEVNGLATEYYLSERVTPYISASTDKARDEMAVKFILDGLPGMRYSIKIKTPQNQVKAIELVHGNLGEKFPPETFPKTIPWKPIEFKWFNDGIACLVLNSFSDHSTSDSVQKLLPELYRAKKLIIDIRENSGGNSEVGFQILKLLTDDKVLFTHASSSRKHSAELKNDGSRILEKDTAGSDWKKEAFLDYNNKLFSTSDYTAYPNDFAGRRIVIPTLVLMGGKTISAGEDFLIPMKNIRHIKTMGETTAGSTGTLYQVKLPGSWGYICSLKSTYPDGSAYVGVGISPDIEVKRTIRGVISMRDEVMEAAVGFLNKNDN